MVLICVLPQVALWVREGMHKSDKIQYVYERAGSYGASYAFAVVLILEFLYLLPVH